MRGSQRRRSSNRTKKDKPQPCKLEFASVNDGDDDVEYVKSSTALLPPVAAAEGEKDDESWGCVVNEKNGQ